MPILLLISISLLLCVLLITLVKGSQKSGQGLIPTGTQANQAEDSHKPHASERRIIVIDCESTGLTANDRLVSLSSIYIDLNKLDSNGNFAGPVGLLHRAYNPNRTSHVQAANVHGLSTEFLSRQPLFACEAQEVWDFIQQGNLLVAHNAKFDVSLLNREFARVGFPPLTIETFCTMELWRIQSRGSPSGLRSIARQLGYKFTSEIHSSLEDVCMCLRIFAYELNLKMTFCEVTAIKGFQNTPL